MHIRERNKFDHIQKSKVKNHIKSELRFIFWKYFLWRKLSIYASMHITQHHLMSSHFKFSTLRIKVLLSLKERWETKYTNSFEISGKKTSPQIILKKLNIIIILCHKIRGWGMIWWRPYQNRISVTTFLEIPTSRNW